MEKTNFIFENRNCVLCRGDKARFLMLQMVDDHDWEGLDEEVAEIERLAGGEFALLAVLTKDWNADLSPWEAPALFGNYDFKGEAKETLSFLEGELLPYIRGRLQLEEDTPVILGGYSLAAFFALWASTVSRSFSYIAAASPSVWFDGYREYRASHPTFAKAVYLSLGDKEEKTRNARMARVGEAIKEEGALLEKEAVEHVLEWNKGNHFVDAPHRSAKAFAWCMKQAK